MYIVGTPSDETWWDYYKVAQRRRGITERQRWRNHGLVYNNIMNGKTKKYVPVVKPCFCFKKKDSRRGVHKSQERFSLSFCVDESMKEIIKHGTWNCGASEVGVSTGGEA